MFKLYNEWYGSLTAFKRLAVSFILNWVYWFIAWLIAEEFFFDEKSSWSYLVFHATWMSFFMTISFNWKELKQIFRPQRKEDEMLQKDV
jgi:hypothetical protein